jgi:hypothetical protein
LSANAGCRRENEIVDVLRAVKVPDRYHAESIEYLEDCRNRRLRLGLGDVLD